MFPVLLAAVLLSSSAAEKAPVCDPSKYLCSGLCPPPPPGLKLSPHEAVCSKDPHSTSCVCWLHNLSSQFHLLFQCDATINDTLSKISCIPPSFCFEPSPALTCLVVIDCKCNLFEQRFHKSDTSWKRVRGIVHTMRKNESSDGHPIEKLQGDVREFSLKHLLFLLGFVIAPLICWCLLNFFHEGKCRKKPPQPPEACPIPTSRSSTVDNMNNEEPDPAAFCIQLPSAPSTAEETTPQQVKCESPPPYCQSVDGNFPIDFGPPPAYDEAVRDPDANIPQMWQAVFIVQPGCRENT